MTQDNLPLGHLTPKPDRFIGHDAVPGEVHQHLYGLVVVDDLPAPHHVPQAVHCVAPTKWIGLAWITDNNKLHLIQKYLDFSWREIE